MRKINEQTNRTVTSLLMECLTISIESIVDPISDNYNKQKYLEI